MATQTVTNGTREMPTAVAGVWPSIVGVQDYGPPLSLSRETTGKLFHLYGFVAPGYVRPSDMLMTNSAIGQDDLFYGGYLPSVDRPAGKRYYKKLVVTQEMTYGSSSHYEIEVTYRLVWNATLCKFELVVDETGSGGEFPWNDFWSAWEDDTGEDLSTPEGITAARAFILANSTVSETENSVSVSIDGLSYSESWVVSEPDDYAAVVARAEDFAANATDAMWATTSAGDSAAIFTTAFFDPRNSWTTATAAVMPTRGDTVWLRPQAPSVICDNPHEVAVLVVRYRYGFAVPGERAGSWTCRSRLVSYTACPPTLKRRNNDTRSPEDPWNPGDPYAAAPVSGVVTRSKTRIETYSVECLQGWFDPFGNPADPADSGWASTAWRWSSFTGYTAAEPDLGAVVPSNSRAVKYRIRGIVGWTGKLRLTRSDGPVDFPWEIGSDGYSEEMSTAVATAQAIDAGTALTWSGAPSLIEIEDADGNAFTAAAASSHLRLEGKVRFLYRAPFTGPSNKRYRTRTVSETESTSLAVTGTPRVLGTAFESAEVVQSYVEESAAGFADLSNRAPTAITLPAELLGYQLTVNGEPVDESDAVQFPAPHILGNLGSSTTVDAGDVRTITWPATDTTFSRSFSVSEFFPVGWADARGSAVPTTSESLVSTMAIPAVAPTSETINSDAMAFASGFYRSAWRVVVASDPDVVVGIGPGWAARA